MVATFVPYLLFGLILGAVVDQVDRKRMMVAVDLARAAVISVLPILAVTDNLEVWHIYVVAFVLSTLGILFDCGEFAAVPSLVPADDLVTANGWIMATNSAGQVLGPVLAGVLLAVVPVANLLFVDAASFLVSALALMAIRGSLQHRRSTHRGAARRRCRGSGRRSATSAKACATCCSHPVLRTISLMMALINFVGATQGAQLVLFAKEELDATDTQVGLLYAAGSAGVVIIGLVAGPIRRRLSFAVTALGALVVSGLACALMGVVALVPGGPRAVGDVQRLRPAPQHQHRRAPPGDHAAAHVRPGHQHRRRPRLVGDPARGRRRRPGHRGHRRRRRGLRRAPAC